MELTFNVDYVDTSYIDNVEAQNVAWALWKCNIEINMKFFIARVDVDHNIGLFLVLKE